MNWNPKFWNFFFSSFSRTNNSSLKHLSLIINTKVGVVVIAVVVIIAQNQNEEKKKEEKTRKRIRARQRESSVIYTERERGKGVLKRGIIHSNGAATIGRRIRPTKNERVFFV